MHTPLSLITWTDRLRPGRPCADHLRIQRPRPAKCGLKRLQVHAAKRTFATYAASRHKVFWASAQTLPR